MARRQIKIKGQVITPERFNEIKPKIDVMRKTMFIKEIAKELGYSSGCIGMLNRAGTWEEYRELTTPQCYSHIVGENGKRVRKVSRPTEFRSLERSEHKPFEGKTFIQPKAEPKIEPSLAPLPTDKPKAGDLNWNILILAITTTLIVLGLAIIILIGSKM